MLIQNDNIKWVSNAALLYKLKQKRKEIETQEAKVMEELRILSADQTCSGGGFLFAKEVRKGNIDYPSIPALRGLDLEVYRKEDVVYFKLSKI